MDKTQKQIISEILNAGRSISQIEATNRYGITRLASIIHVLRRDGLPIASEIRKSKKNNNEYAVYYIDNEKQVSKDEPSLFWEDSNHGWESAITGGTAMRLC